MQKRTPLYVGVLSIILLIVVLVVNMKRNNEVKDTKEEQTAANIKTVSESTGIQTPSPASELSIQETTTGNDLPIDNRVNIVEDLLENNFPLVPNLRKTNKDRTADKSIPQLVAEVGDPWSASSFRAGVTYNLSNDAWLYLSFENNLRVKQLIELGRKNPEYVGGLVSKDLIRRKNEWIATAEAYYDSDKKGYLVGDDGSIVGNKSALKYEEDTYAIEADIFILMNIDYTKGLDSLAEYCAWYVVPPIVKFKRQDGTIKELAVSNAVNKPNKNNLNSTVLYCALAHLLQKCNDEKFESAKKVLTTTFKEEPASSQRITDSPEALWPINDPVLNAAGIDTSSEPTMKPYFPNDKVLRPMNKSILESAKFNLVYVMAKIHDPNVRPGL